MITEPDNPKPPEIPRISMRGLLVAVAGVALCAAVVTYPFRRAQSDKRTTIAIVKQVKAIRAKLGRAPRNQTELEALLGRPMPVVHDYLFKTPIMYQRTGENSFYLHYDVRGTDYWMYDSAAPEAGWVWRGL